MKTVTLKLPARLDSKLTYAAKRRRTTKSAIVQKALEAYFRDDRRPAKQGSFLELAAKGVGCVEGTGDLSYNPAHMQGFGD